MTGIVTPLHWREWHTSLYAHPDRRFTNIVVSGIQGVFRVGFDYSHRYKKAKKNMVSAEGGWLVISQYLAKECAEGRVFPQI